MDTVTVEPEVGEDTPYFAVSLWKLTVMSVCTFSLYEIWWFYKNWHHIKRREKADITPLLRAVFAYFFCYQCFARIRASAQSASLDVWLPAGPLAIGWVIVSLLWKLPDPYWLVCYLSVIFLLPVQAVANNLNTQAIPSHDPNSSFKEWNWVAVAAGVVLHPLVIIGTFLPEN